MVGNGDRRNVGPAVWSCLFRKFCVATEYSERSPKMVITLFLKLFFCFVINH